MVVVKITNQWGAQVQKELLIICPKKTCKEARKYTPVLIKDQRPFIADSYFNELALGVGQGVYFLAFLHVFWDISSIVLFKPKHHTGQFPLTLPSRESSGKCNMAIGGGEVASYKGGGECHILAMGW